ncbi:hypothetical protein [Natrialbaceae archaeon AArc-T1-2]|uniref:hypothetical protein n=1 Tax=Natrialbaceae archaeon AArc-T1-2 TaxID=3053904 RepID=UPI00255AEF42|nr:hypothetical protein [Natrialbaceae archaeon AArc-T1-2]WIV65976.1 hypothetical protein QQ977_09730 [Natrialbaceae archaeon AArc-T1-2]
MDDPRLSRRQLLAGVGSVASVATVSGLAAGARQTATLHVRIYPGPTPENVRTVRGWSWAHLESAIAVSRALDTLAREAERRTALEGVDVRLEPASPVSLEVGRDAQETILDAFRERLRERNAITGECCHLLLWWDPLNYDLGYGGVRWPNSHVGKDADEGSQTVANVGATEAWDSRAVTRNMAIHETLHTFLAPDVVDDVIDSRCDHDLGSATRVGETLRISPIATAYAGPDRIGGGTQFHGTGCYDHDSFYRHDGYDGVNRWEYTTTLSEGVREGVARYLERYLATD